jgi:hypothetical protein
MMILLLYVFVAVLRGETANPEKSVALNPYNGMQKREERFEFAVKPAVKREGNKWLVTFTARACCDATVAVVDKEGRVIRHLASGVLGKNAPYPFQQDTLSQRVEWDGKDDYGNIATNAGGIVVGLGMRVDFHRFIFQREPGIESRGPVSVACDKKGNVYIMWGHLWTARFTGIANITAFDSAGNYLRTVKPFRADWPEEKISAVEWLTTADGRRVPLTGPNNHTPFSGYLPGMAGMARHTAQITKDGRYIFVSGREVPDEKGMSCRRLLCIGTDGSCPKTQFIGPPLPEGTWQGDTFLALSPDEQYVYIAGTYHGKKKTLHHAVYRVQWSDREFPRPFVGIECEAGKDEKHFNTPRGLAVDSDGRLYVCDYMNDRVQVFDVNGKYLKTLEVTGPEQIVIHPQTGALYILSIKDRGKTEKYAEVRWEVYTEKSLIKYKSWQEFIEVARFDFPQKPRYFHDCGPILALDSSGTEPVLWVSIVVKSAPTDFLWKIIDKGNELKPVEHQIKGQERGSSVSAPALASSVDYDEFYLVGGGLSGAFRIRAGTGNMEKIPLPSDALTWLGSFTAGRDGTLYFSTGKLINPPRDMRWVIKRYNRDGKALPFPEKEGIETLGYHAGTYAGEKCGNIAVDMAGRIYVSECSQTGGTARAVVNLYDSDGKLLKKGLIADMTHTAGPLAVFGDRMLYVADAVKPAGAGPGAEFPAFLGADPRKHFRMWYGTVALFGPSGGAFRHVTDNEKFTHVGGYPGGRGKVVIEGAYWTYFGISPQPQSSQCECPRTDIDADEYGRIYIPDVCTSSVQILDSAGNFIMRFGSYGNWEAQGPNSAVPTPAIPLRYPSDVAVVDRFIAVSDSYNRRVLELCISYASEETISLP